MITELTALAAKKHEEAKQAAALACAKCRRTLEVASRSESQSQVPFKLPATLAAELAQLEVQVSSTSYLALLDIQKRAWTMRDSAVKTADRALMDAHVNEKKLLDDAEKRIKYQDLPDEPHLVWIAIFGLGGAGVGLILGWKLIQHAMNIYGCLVFPLPVITMIVGAIFCSWLGGRFMLFVSRALYRSVAKAKNNPKISAARGAIYRIESSLKMMDECRSAG